MQGKGFKKAITFSYDDGVTQDQRLIGLFNKYDLKGTFNINSGLFGRPNSLIRENVTVSHVRPRTEEIRGIYEGHEVAAHTLTHPHLTDLSEEEIVHEVEDDRQFLSEVVGYEVVGMAYPGGGVNYDARVAEVLKRRTGIRYARTTECNGSFDLQEDLLTFHPTVYHLHHYSEMFRLAEEFLNGTPDKPQVFYIWGHAYEFDIDKSWKTMEGFLEMVSRRKDVFYGTNKEILLSDEWMS